MKPVLKTIDELGADRWDRFVENHPHGSVYHTSAWHRVIEKAYGYSPRYLVLTDEQGEIRAGLPFTTVRNLFLGERMVAFPFSDYCDPLAETDEHRAELTSRFFSLAPESGLKGAEIRFYRNADELSEPTISNFVLDLRSGEEAIFQRFHKSCIQRVIRKAEREEVEIVSGATDDDLEAFYQLHLATRRKLGVPSQPLCFFQHLRNEMGRIGAFELLLARYKGEVVGAHILLHLKDTAYYRFGASNPDVLWVGPNHLLFWKAIQSACRAGRDFFDFGRASRHEETLALFKRRWGAVARPLSYSTSGQSASAVEAASGSVLAGLASSIVRHLPLPMLRFSGALYRFLA